MSLQTAFNEYNLSRRSLIAADIEDLAKIANCRGGIADRLHESAFAKLDQMTPEQAKDALGFRFNRK